MQRINIKPLSVNEAWKGRRFRTDQYKAYQQHCSLILPRKIDVPEGKLKLTLIFGLSNMGADYDNPIKPFQDIISAKYGFNDNRIYAGYQEKVKVDKGSEFIAFKLEAFKSSLK